MKLKVPVNSYESAVKQIDAGADEIYMGLEDALFSTMSFSARAQVTSNGSRSTLTEAEFAKSVEYAHARNVAVNFTANCQHITKSPDDFYRRTFLDYVQRGIALGVDALIVADIGNLIALQKAGVKTPVIAGSYLNCFNSETVDFLKRLGVFRICIPDHVTLEEIKAMKNHSDVEIEAFIGYGCSRIDSLKLTGREMNSEEVVKLTRMYKDAILTYTEGREFNRRTIISAIPWWESDMCGDTHCKRCRYEDTSLLRSYI